MRAGERRESRWDSTLSRERAVRKEKNGEKTEEKSRRSRAPTKGAGLVRASRPGYLPPTDTDSNALAVVKPRRYP